MSDVPTVYVVDAYSREVGLREQRICRTDDDLWTYIHQILRDVDEDVTFDVAEREVVG